jgi:hypothetical protein
MEKRTDYLTATYVDLAVNVAAVFGLEVGLRVLQPTTPIHVVLRVLSEGGPRRCGAALIEPEPSLNGEPRK